LKIFIERLGNIEGKVDILTEELKALRKESGKLIKLLEGKNVDDDFITVSIF